MTSHRHLVTVRRVHLFLVYVFCCYAMWLLEGHYKWYVLLRQHYLTMGDSVFPWLGHAVAPRQQDSAGVGMGTAASVDGPGGVLPGDGGAFGDGQSPANGTGAAGHGACYAAPPQQVVVEMVEQGAQPGQQQRGVGGAQVGLQVFVEVRFGIQG